MEKLKTLLFNKVFLGVLVALMGTFLLFPSFFVMGFYPIPAASQSIASIDPSWMIALSHANINNMVWGQDIAFTYGPLSYLALRTGWGINKIDFILYDLFISINFFYLFFKGFINSKQQKLTVILIVAVSYFVPVYFGSGTSIILMAFLIFWIRESLENDNYINYIFQVILVVLMFFIKFNTGLISFIILIAFLGYQWFFNPKLRKLYLLYAAIIPVLLVVFSYFLNVSIINYFLSGLNLISGFNEIMHLDLGFVNELFFAVLFMVLSVMLLLKEVYQQKQIQFKKLLVLFMYSISIYVLYKQAFVRADIWHITEFFSLSLLYVIALREFHVEKLNANAKGIVLGLVFICFFVAKGKSDTLFTIPGKISKADYFSELNNFTPESSMRLFPNDNKIPERILTKIGNKTVDIFPWNISLLFENKLNYKPRPVLQSYSAYTPYLEELNFQHYNSDQAPEFVFYEFESVDNRYPLFDETKVNIALFENYTCIDTFDLNSKPILVLQKNSNFRPIVFEKTKEYQVDVKTPITPEMNRFVMAEVNSSFSGTVESLLTHTPALFLMINTKDGTSNGYKTSMPLLKSGFFSNQFLKSTIDFKNAVNKEALPENQQIVSYTVWPEENKYFNEKITVTEYKIIKK